MSETKNGMASVVVVVVEPVFNIQKGTWLQQPLQINKPWKRNG
jgi:hypothetical protein